MNFTPAQPYTRQFLTISDTCSASGGGGCPDDMETDQSHGILIQSNLLPRLYQAHDRWWAYEYNGSGTSLFSNGPVSATIGNQKAMAAFHTSALAAARQIMHSYSARRSIQPIPAIGAAMNYALAVIRKQT